LTDAWSTLAARLAGRRVVQLISDLTFGDAASADTVAWQRVFQRHGVDSPIYARRVEGPHGGQASHLDGYTPWPGDLLVFHYTVWSEAAELVRSEGLEHVMIYHNITPPGFFVLFEPRLAADARKGREQLAALAPLCRLGLADSSFNRQELDDAGFTRTGVVPILLELHDDAEPGDPALARELADGRTNVLYTGRIAPNKRIEETIVVFAYYRRADPTARLLLVGAFDDTDQYATSLRILVDRLGLRESVVFTGKVPRAKFVTYYRAAHVYLTMS
jgi:glycosyltransferase involved in cell wall biosynthesis